MYLCNTNDSMPHVSSAFCAWAKCLRMKLLIFKHKKVGIKCNHYSSKCDTTYCETMMGFPSLSLPFRRHWWWWIWCEMMATTFTVYLSPKSLDTQTHTQVEKARFLMLYTSFHAKCKTFRNGFVGHFTLSLSVCLCVCVCQVRELFACIESIPHENEQRTSRIKCNAFGNGWSKSGKTQSKSSRIKSTV